MDKFLITGRGWVRGMEVRGEYTTWQQAFSAWKAMLPDCASLTLWRVSEDGKRKQVPGYGVRRNRSN